jgi:ATP-dependent DNA helicase Rep
MRDRRPPSNHDLNPAQRHAVETTAGPVLVLAGAGSGKTRVITRKIAHLSRSGLAPEQIAAVTFTNKAAREMRARAAASMGRAAAKAARISTFHRLGLEILRGGLDEVGLRRGFTIFDSEDSLGLVRELARRHGLKADDFVPQYAWRISSWKSDGVDPTELKSSDPIDRAAALIYPEYRRELLAYNAVDFDDLILLPVELLKTHDGQRAAWRKRIRYLLVDEYQDTNLTQYELVKLLVGAEANFTVVGDDDQSIYAWRGARPENLQQLAEDFPALSVVKLEQNYRCSGHILKAANGLIAHNPHLFEKRLWSDHGPGDAIRVMLATDTTDEAERIAAEIYTRKITGDGTSWSDVAVLYRSNHLARPFEEALRSLRIPYQVSGGTSFFDRSEVRDVIAYLRLMVNPDDDAAFLRVVNVPRRQIGANTLERLTAVAARARCSLMAAIAVADEGLEGRARLRLVEFRDWVAGKAELAERDDPVLAVEELLADCCFEQHIRINAKEPAQAEKRWDNVVELVSWLKRGMKDLEEVDLAGLLNHLCLLDQLDRNEDEADQDAVRLMTLHAAKGLEFPHVYMVAMEEGLLPHRNSIESDTVEEERRLAYVGLTRAQYSLVLSYAEQRRRYGQMMSCQPSRFLDELPDEVMNWEVSREPATEEERQATGAAALDDLRNLLGN